MIACVTGTQTAATVTWIRCTATSNGTADGTTVYTNGYGYTGDPDDDEWQWFVVTCGDDQADEFVPVTGRPWPSAQAPRARRRRPPPARGVNVRVESWPVPGRTFR